MYRVNAREGKMENDKRKGELDQQIATIDAKMRRLTQMRIDDELPKSEYLEFKSDLEKKKKSWLDNALRLIQKPKPTRIV